MTTAFFRLNSVKLLVRPAHLILLVSALWLLTLAGCVTAPKSVPPPPPNVFPAPAVPAAAPQNKPPAPPPKPPAPPSVASPPASTPALPKDEFVMSIDSEPSGATIVVNGIPIGKAPLQLKVKTTLQGFFRDYLTVKARFLATSEDETSITVEDDCTPREKIPGKIMFTPQGAQRWQQEPADEGK
jgi:hypothetical protein